MSNCSLRGIECACRPTECRAAPSKQITADQNAEWRAYNRALFSAVSFTVLCALTGCLLMLAAVQMERQERENMLIAQESTRHG
jgi:hypothetical protein